jgi:hypothetical protein
MPSWLVSAALAAVVVVVLLVSGAGEAVTIFVVIFAWFLLLGGLALLFETLAQLPRHRGPR